MQRPVAAAAAAAAAATAAGRWRWRCRVAGEQVGSAASALDNGCAVARALGLLVPLSSRCQVLMMLHLDRQNLLAPGCPSLHPAARPSPTHGTTCRRPPTDAGHGGGDCGGRGGQAGACIAGRARWPGRRQAERRRGPGCRGVPGRRRAEPRRGPGPGRGAAAAGRPGRRAAGAAVGRLLPGRGAGGGGGCVGCWAAGLLGCWAAGLLGCWAAGLLGLSWRCGWDYCGHCAAPTLYCSAEHKPSSSMQGPACC
jgi:hypothetical protein